MLVEILIGIILAILAIDRFHKIVAIFPSLLDSVFYVFFKKDECDEKKKIEEINIIEGEIYEKIPKNIDESLTKLFDIIYDEYILNISNIIDLSQDTHRSFIIIIRHILSDLCLRLSKVDIELLLTEYIIPKILNHLVRCKHALIKHGNKIKITDVYENNEIHTGILLNNYDENDYHKNLFESILRLSCCESQNKSRLLILLLRSSLISFIFNPIIDKITNSQNIPYLIISLLNSDNNITVKDHTQIVPILYTFSNRSLIKYRSVINPPKNFMLTWKQLQCNPSLLYICMQVLKKGNRFIFAHFCITIDEWNIKANKVDNSVKCIQEIIQESYKIYKSFISSSNVYRLKYNNDIINKFEEYDFNEYTYQNLIKIQSLLNVCYKLAYDILTTDCLEYFYHSSQFFMLCFGERPKITDKLVTFHMVQSRKEFNTQSSSVVVDNKGGNASSSCGVTGSNVNDNITNQPSILITNSNNNQQISSSDEEEEHISDCVSVESNMTEQTTCYDLSSLRVQVIDLRTSWKKNAKIFYFLIHVQSLIQSNKDDINSSWDVARQYKEFYGLENRLKRFHGGRISDSLPPKRSILFSKNWDFLKNCKKPFQDYLECLLHNPFLRYSSMLYAFLNQDTTIGSSSIFSKTPTIDTGRALQNVIGTLSSEKGKYIDGFINNFALSTEISRPKGSNKISLSKFKKKFKFLQDDYQFSSESSTYIKPIPIIKFDILHNFIHTFITIIQPRNIIKYICHLFYALFGGITELLLRRWLSLKIKQYTSSVSISIMIDSISNYLTSTNSNNVQENNDPIKMIVESLPMSIKIAISHQSITQNIHNILQLTECQNLNKQLFFNIFDDIISFIYPELADFKPTKSVPNFYQYCNLDEL